MRVDQLDAGKNMCVKNIRFKKKILNYFLQNIFYPDIHIIRYKSQMGPRSRAIILYILIYYIQEGFRKFIDFF